MIEWFNNLAARERLYVIIGSFVVIATLYFLLIFEPLLKGKQHAQEQHAATVELYSFMQQSMLEVQRLQQQISAQHTKVAADKLLGLVDQGLRSAGIDKDLKSIKPESAGGVRLRFDSVNFDVLIKWLTEFHNRNGVNIVTFTITETTQPGLVKASLLLN